MKSTLTLAEFEFRMKEEIRIGTPEIMGSPFAILTIFDFSGKKFFGEFGHGKFRITKNAALPVPTGYIVSGSYARGDGNSTKVTYEIRPILFSYYWNRVGPIFGGIVLNGALILNIKTAPFSVFAVVNCFIGLIAFLAITVDKFAKRRLEKRFREEFEIEA